MGRRGYRIAIVGAGFTGAMVAVHLLRNARNPIELMLFDRRGTFGRGLAYSARNPQHLLNTLQRLRAGIERMRRIVADTGRDPRHIAVAYRVQRHGGGIPALADNGERRLFSGGPAEIAGDLRALAELGVSAVDFGFTGKTVEATLADMKRFREDVVSRM